MITIKINNIFCLVSIDNPGTIYPKLFTNKEQAEQYATSLGGKWKIHYCFINEE